MIRNAAFADKFYTSNKSALSKTISEFIGAANVDSSIAERSVAYVAPHAGYTYSGSVAGFTYKALSMRKGLDRTDTFVVIGPNHTGRGPSLSISDADWKTPLGLVKNDHDLTLKIAAASDSIKIDEEAHAEEHSVEVQLPFLQKVVQWPKCCFICMGDQSREASLLLSRAIRTASDELGRRIIVIASSDLNHYESAEVAKSKDMPAIEAICRLDADSFQAKISGLGDSACGYGPITVSALVAQKYDARRGILLKYANSGDVTKDYKSVVAYSSIVFI